MYILGLSAFYHDSAAVLTKDGEVVFAVEEERLSRIKHDSQFPLRAALRCMDEAGLSLGDVDCVAYYEKPLLKFERIIENFVETWPLSFQPFVRGIPEWLSSKIKIENLIRKGLGVTKGKVFFIPHHFSHAAAAFFPSPFEESAIFTIDGVGEYQTTGLWRGSQNRIVPLKSINFPHSVGLLYATFTAFFGFQNQRGRIQSNGTCGIRKTGIYPGYPSSSRCTGRRKFSTRYAFLFFQRGVPNVE